MPPESEAFVDAVVLTAFDPRPRQATLDAWKDEIRAVRASYEASKVRRFFNTALRICKLKSIATST